MIAINNRGTIITGRRVCPDTRLPEARRRVSGRVRADKSLKRRGRDRRLIMKNGLICDALRVARWKLNAAGRGPMDTGNEFIWSSELRGMLGYKAKPYRDTLGGWLKNLHPDDLKRAMNACAAYFANPDTGAPFDIDLRVKNAEGKYICMRSVGVAEKDKNGRIYALTGVAEYVTDAKRQERKSQERGRTLNILNQIALLLLSRSRDDIDSVMEASLVLISDIAAIERMSVFSNADIQGIRCLSQIYRWRKKEEGIMQTWKELRNIPYNAISSRYETMLVSGECVTGLVKDMPDNDIFLRFGCVSVLVVPIFDDGVFWGITLFEKLAEQNFSPEETDALRSASFMLANAIIRDKEAALIRDGREQIQLIIDSLPIALTIHDRNQNVLDCSQYAVNLLGFDSKEDLCRRLTECTARYQPDGRLSQDVILEEGDRALKDGAARMEWVQHTVRGEPVLLETNLVRVKYSGEDMLMCCARDIRAEKRMLAELAERDRRLEYQAHWYWALLDGIPLPISVTDMDMRLAFVNQAAESTFNRHREDIIGQHCSIWGCSICGGENCSVELAKSGSFRTYFKQADHSYQVDTVVLRDPSGEQQGWMEILQDITEAERQARSAAEVASTAKSAFLASMSHEMRTSISAVIGLSEMVMDNGELSDDNKLHLEKIYDAGTTLLAVVNDILDISRIEAGHLDMFQEEYDIALVINDCVTQNILRIKDKPIRFVLSIDEHMPARLLGDDLRVKQIVNNLLSNAFKYTDEGEVELIINHETDGDSVWLTFTITDTGIGIKKEDMEHLYTNYIRLNESHKSVGTGLGLSITKQLVEMMDGEIHLESEYGKGTVVIACVRQGYVSDAVIGAEMSQYLSSLRYISGKRLSGGQLIRTRIPSARVLVVDDNITNLDIARSLLSPYGMRVDCVVSGMAAISAVRETENIYDIIFMDHMMPGMDGVETTRVIREDIGTEYAGTVPIIALTANAIAGSREQYLSGGFSDFLSKPIDIFHLDAIIRRFISDKHSKETVTEIHAERRSGFDRRRTPDRRQSARGRGDRRSGCERRKSEGGQFLGFVPGLNWRVGIRLFGTEEDYLKVLRSYAINTASLLKTVADPQKDDLTDYTITVHGIKSSSRGIAADAVGDMAEAMELAARAEDIDYLTKNNAGFIQHCEKLISDINEVLQKVSLNRQRTVREEPDGELLKALKEACLRYDMDAIEDILQKLRSFEYTADGGLVDWLTNSLEGLNYSQVADRLQNL